MCIIHCRSLSQETEEAKCNYLGAGCQMAVEQGGGAGKFREKEKKGSYRWVSENVSQQNVH